MKNIHHPHSRYTHEAVRLLAHLIKAKRLEKKVSLAALSERAGISRGLLQRIEKGDFGCSLGATFEVAVLLGIPLFYPDPTELKRHGRLVEEKLALLPKSARARHTKVDDDF